MREEHSSPSDDSMVNGDGAQRRSLAPQGQQSNGFTAVNGDRHSNSPFRADDSAKQYLPPYANENKSPRRAAPIDTGHRAHGWRSDDRAAREQESGALQSDASPTRKRKQSISISIDNQNDDRTLTTSLDGIGSPKRRKIPNLDSAIDLTSPATTMQSALPPIDRRQHDSASIGPYARERSPLRSWNQSEPPPKPRPETEALLAESAIKFHQTQQSQQNQQSQASPERQASSPANDADHREGNASGDEQPRAEGDDPKKARKRNFSNRTKTGCHTCRNRKKKCDERKPYCGNCERGNFPCQGYGPKAANGTKVVATRQLQVQPKAYETAAAPPGPYYQSPSDEQGLSYSHWGRVPAADQPPSDHGRPYNEVNMPDQRYPPPSRDGWHKQGWAGSHVTPSQFQDRFPPPDYPHGPHYHYSSTQTALPPPQPPAPLPISDPFAQYGDPDPYHRSSNRASRVPSSHSGSNNNNNNNNSSQHTAHLALTMNAFQPSEKDKMLRGQPFMHWLDNVLIGERDSCSVAIDCYNKGSRSDKGLGREAKAELFAQILDPGKRMHAGVRGQQQSSPSPVGTVKDHTIVESPFKCDYGYNIHLGSASVVQAGCYLEDAADITIGDRVIVGPEVKIYTLTAAVDSGARKGSQGHVIAGAVQIEDDVFIGANSIILPYCTIGRGAVVGAGSVVTRDVKENTVVAGNPAKFIRSITSNGSGGGAESDRRHAYEIQERNERVKKRMNDYANAGFNRYSPRLI